MPTGQTVRCGEHRCTLREGQRAARLTGESHRDGARHERVLIALAQATG
jgi:hypothetical protein